MKIKTNICKQREQCVMMNTCVVDNIMMNTCVVDNIMMNTCVVDNIMMNTCVVDNIAMNTCVVDNIMMNTCVVDNIMMNMLKKSLTWVHKYIKPVPSVVKSKPEFCVNRYYYTYGKLMKSRASNRSSMFTEVS
jgi:predicted metal-dependent hydrolase